MRGGKRRAEEDGQLRSIDGSRGLRHLVRHPRGREEEARGAEGSASLPLLDRLAREGKKDGGKTTLSPIATLSRRAVYSKMSQGWRGGDHFEGTEWGELALPWIE